MTIIGHSLNFKLHIRLVTVDLGLCQGTEIIKAKLLLTSGQKKRKGKQNSREVDIFAAFGRHVYPPKDSSRIPPHECECVKSHAGTSLMVPSSTLVFKPCKTKIQNINGRLIPTAEVTSLIEQTTKARITEIYLFF